MNALEIKQEAVNEASARVRALKAQDASADAIARAIDELKDVKIALDVALTALREEGNVEAKAKEEFRGKLSTVLEGRMFYVPSFKIYGGVAGLYDYGPPGCAVKANVQQFWRQHFVLEESMLEVECPAVTPEMVLKASGHVDKFTDLMVNDIVTKECYRADHLLGDRVEVLLKDPMLKSERRRELEDLEARIDELNPEEMARALKETETKAPGTNNDLCDPYPFNLMFPTQIGPSGALKGFLRPETAQGIFVNFRDLLYYNGGKLPFACAQIGQSFRNEIAPRAGLLRVREFTQAEIEHFVHPEHKEHPRFVEVKDTVLNLFSQSAQLGDVKKPFLMTVGEAVSKGIIANETLGYFIARCHLFMLQIGIDSTRLRFRQHLKHEMAHYAADCWDAEIQCSYGWIECVGLADRSAFDLKAHSDKSKVDLVAYERFAEPIQEQVVEITPNKQLVGKAFKKDAKAVTDALAALSEADAFALQDAIAANGSAPLQTDSGEMQITTGMVTVERVTKTLNGRNYTPSVIEPSFGIGRIMYCMFEHAFYIRPDDEQKTVLRLTPIVAPIKTTILPLVNERALNVIAAAMNKSLTAAGISAKLDTTAISIGKRYARTDELGVPFAVTVDLRSTTEGTVTVRERDSCDQVRVPIPQVPELLRSLCAMHQDWASATAGFERQAVAADDAYPRARAIALVEMFNHNQYFAFARECRSTSSTSPPPPLARARAFERTRLARPSDARARLLFVHPSALALVFAHARASECDGAIALDARSASHSSRARARPTIVVVDVVDANARRDGATDENERALAR